jgi:phenylalanyl-tRNA synthetase beta chain
MNSLNVKYEIQEVKHSSFSDGRTARASVSGREIAFIGEINPAVLQNFGLKVPVAAFELNLSELFEVMKR